MQQNQPIPVRPFSRLASLLQRVPPPAPTPAPAPAPATQPTPPPPIRAPIRLASFPGALTPPTTALPPPPPPPPAPAPEVLAPPPLRPIQTRPPTPSPTQVTPPQTSPVPSPKTAQTQVTTAQRQTSPSPPLLPSPKPAQTQVTTAQRQTSPSPPPLPSPKPAQTQMTIPQRQTSPRSPPPGPPPSPKPEISQNTTSVQPQRSPISASTEYAQPWTSTMPPAPISTSVPPSPKSSTAYPTALTPASPRPRAAVSSQSLAPPQSPKIIKPSEPTPPPSPKTIQQQPTPPPYPKVSTPEHKSIFSQYSKNGNGNSKVISDKKEEPPVEKNHTHLSPKNDDGVADGKSGSNSTTLPGKKKAEKGKEEEQTGWRLITLAGENVGAYMELGSGYQKLQKSQPASLFKYQHNSQINEVQENKPGSDMKESMTASKARPLAALVNSNVQAINNSMVFNSSCAHKSPGVHLKVSSHRLPTGTSSPSHPKKSQ